MAANATAAPKLKGAFNVEFQSKDGSWKEVKVEKAFVIPQTESDVDVNVTDADGSSTRKVNRNFRRKIVTSVKEAIELLSNNETRYITLAGINYAFDLFARGAIKGPIATEEEGPGKVIAKAAEQMVANFEKLGIPFTLDEALKLVQAQIAAKQAAAAPAESESESTEEEENQTEE